MTFLKKIRHERGMALIIALVLTLMLTIVGLGIIKSANDELSIAGNEMHEMTTFYTAEAGLEKSMALIQNYYEDYDRPPDTLPAETLQVNEIIVFYESFKGDTSTSTISKGSMAGLMGLTQPFIISATAIDSANNSTITLQETFEVGLVPIFQFSVFYDEDLEIAPGPSMLLLGRVHSNGDLYIQSENSLHIDSYMTAHGDIYHGRKPGSGLSDANGDVDIMSLDGSYYSMKDGSDWLDSEDSYWFDSSVARWGGRVQDASYGQESLNLPLEDESNPHAIIERDTANGGNPDSFENEAELKIVEGTALWYNGSSWIDVTTDLETAGILQETTFRDRREGEDVTVYDIDLNAFSTSSYFPSNGIVWTADDRSGYRATRLYNADEVESDIGFTLASENPVYTQGDVNSVDKKPMAIITDALTILSNNWDDANATLSTSDRQATDTETNFAYITGNRETGGSYYNGGLENLPHFLETWSGDTLTYTGSMICLWQSQVSTSWPTEYSPPYRDWSFDNDLTDPDKMPPGTPCVRTFIRMGWHQENVGYVFTEEMLSETVTD